MKILLSPSKTMTPTVIPTWSHTDWLFPKQTKKLISTIRKRNKAELSKALKVTNDLLNQTYQAYQSIHQVQKHHAFPSFSGLVFQQLDIPSYSETQLQYIKSHIRILDALFGLLEPSTSIPPYRLDMKASIGINLYQYWSGLIQFDDDIIINLASKEFSSMVPNDMITIEFYQCTGTTCKQQATYSKMGRGLMCHYMIKNQVTTLHQIKEFNEDGYRYDPDLSSSSTIAFRRE